MSNIPRVKAPTELQKFCNAVKESLDTLFGKRDTPYDRALTVRDLQRLKINGVQIDLDTFLACGKQNPYDL